MIGLLGEGITLHAELPPSDAAAAAELLEGSYWNAGLSRERLAAAHLGSTAWVGAKDDAGRLVGSARALSDGAKWAWIYDVIVAPAFRRRGIACALVRMLLDHPRVRGAKNVRLATRDAQRLYQRLGFCDVRELPEKAYRSTEMALMRE